MLIKKFNFVNKYIVIISAFLLIITGANAQELGTNNSFVGYLRNADSTVGISGCVLVMKDSTTVVCEGFGLANRELSVPSTPDSKFLLCSVTKQFTATGIMQLAERKLLSLDDSITKFITAYAGSSADKVTVYHLLTQTSGIVEYLELVDSNETFNKPVPIGQMISLFMGKPLAFEPGSKWEYSNSNYILLGRIIEVVSGMGYGDYIQKNIFQPLHMDNSGFPDNFLNDLPNSASGYRSTKAGDIKLVEPVHSSWPYSAGGLYSSINDIAKWDMALRNNTILSRGLTQKMFTPFQWRYGCGWEIDTLYGHPVALHGGTGAGFCSIIIRVIDYPVCVVILSNNENSMRKVSKMAYDLVAIAFDSLKTEIKSDQIVVVNSKILSEYAGKYELAPNVVISFISRDGKLFSQGPGQPEIEIFPRSDTEFFLKVVQGSITFVRDSSGAVSGIVVHQGGRDLPAKRIK